MTLLKKLIVSYFIVDQGFAESASKIMNIMAMATTIIAMITMAMVTLQNYEHYDNGNKYYGNGNNAKNYFAIFSPGTVCTGIMWKSRKTQNIVAMATMYCVATMMVMTCSSRLATAPATRVSKPPLEKN